MLEVSIVDLDGITPAYAGSMARWCIHRGWSWDHPRIRGEHKGDIPFLRSVIGSPPHTRGALYIDWEYGRITRITPAYAGSIYYALQARNARWDHPRIRGEHDYGTLNATAMIGSPPHTRGAWLVYPAFVSCIGITPAYAGSIISPPSRSMPAGDHPRIRGEHRSRLGAASRSRGSPPHTRGA